MTPLCGKVAFVTGANGITGNALVEHLIRQPESEWAHIIITSRRRPAQVFWQDHRIRFIALDFLDPLDELIETMRPFCHHVTHAFFASYVHCADFSNLREFNVPLFENFLKSIDYVAGSSLQRVVLHTGGKDYLGYFQHNGVHLGPVEAPIHEGMQRYEDHGENFYYSQEDFMFDLASKRVWDWNVIRPNAIIGFTPAGNGMSAALTLAIYILCCREVGEVPVFPGNKYFWNSVDDSSYAPSIADMSLWAATGNQTKNESFVHTGGDVIVWKHFWPKLTRYYGVELPEEAYASKAEGDDERMTHSFRMADWAEGKKEVWQRVVAHYGGHPDAFDWGTWDFFDWALGKAWYTIGSVSKARKFGWKRYDDSLDAWTQTFRSFENAGILPITMPRPTVDVDTLPRLPNPADVVNARLARKTESANPTSSVEEKAESVHVETVNAHLPVSNVMTA